LNESVCLHQHNGKDATIAATPSKIEVRARRGENVCVGVRNGEAIVQWVQLVEMKYLLYDIIT